MTIKEKLEHAWKYNYPVTLAFQENERKGFIEKVFKDGYCSMSDSIWMVCISHVLSVTACNTEITSDKTVIEPGRCHWRSEGSLVFMDGETTLHRASYPHSVFAVDPCAAAAIVERHNATLPDTPEPEPSILDEKWSQTAWREGVPFETGTVILSDDKEICIIPDAFHKGVNYRNAIVLLPDAYRALEMVRCNKRDDNGTHPITRQTMADVDTVLKKAGLE